jgi:protein phosphatase
MFQRVRGWWGGNGAGAAAPAIDPPPGRKLPPAVLEIRASVATNPGCVRAANQDAALFTRPPDGQALATHGVIALLADGMGGHQGGEIASALACEKIPHHYFASSQPTAAALRAALETANREIYQAAQAQPELHGMGTTAVAFAITGGQGWLAYVGDSRLYLIRRGQIYRMSEDHSMVFEMVHQGLLTMDEARNHQDRNVLSRALGSHPQVEVSCWDEPFLIQPGDRFLLCSDGLHDLVTDEKILELARSGDVGAATERLVRAANENGGYDNISVILLEAVYAAPARLQPPPTREYPLP